MPLPYSQPTTKKSAVQNVNKGKPHIKVRQVVMKMMIKKLRICYHLIFKSFTVSHNPPKLASLTTVC